MKLQCENLNFLNKIQIFIQFNRIISFSECYYLLFIDNNIKRYYNFDNILINSSILIIINLSISLKCVILLYDLL